MKKFKGISLKKRKQYFYYFVLIFSSVLLLAQYQNCSAGNGGGLVLGSNCVGTACTPPPSQCVGTYCGGYVDYLYWNNCEAHMIGWAWSDSPNNPKRVNFTLTDGYTNSVFTSISMPDVRTFINTHFPTQQISSDFVGFHAVVPSKTYSGNKLNVAAATVDGSSQKFNILDSEHLIGTSLIPDWCNGGSTFGFPDACASGEYPGFGYIDSANVDSNCNLTISGWAWTKDGSNGAGTTVVLYRGDGMQAKTSIGGSRSDVPNLYSCVNTTSGFTYTWSKTSFSASALAADKTITISPYVYSTVTGLMQPFAPRKTNVIPTNCRN